MKTNMSITISQVESFLSVPSSLRLSYSSLCDDPTFNEHSSSLRRSIAVVGRVVSRLSTRLSSWTPEMIEEDYKERLFPSSSVMQTVIKRLVRHYEPLNLELFSVLIQAYPEKAVEYEAAASIWKREFAALVLA